MFPSRRSEDPWKDFRFSAGGIQKRL